MSFYLKPTDGGEPIIVVSQVPQNKLQEVSTYLSLEQQEAALKVQQLDCRQKIQEANQKIQVADKNIQAARPGQAQAQKNIQVADQNILAARQGQAQAQSNIVKGRQEMNPIIDKLITFLTQQKTSLDQVNLKKPTLEGQNLVEKIKGYISSLETAKNPETDAKVVVSTINTTQQSLQTLGAEIQKFQQSLNRK